MGEHKNKTELKGDYFKKEQRLSERRRGRYVKVAQLGYKELARRKLKQMRVDLGEPKLTLKEAAGKIARAMVLPK